MTIVMWSEGGPRDIELTWRHCFLCANMYRHNFDFSRSTNMELIRDLMLHG